MRLLLVLMITFAGIALPLIDLEGRLQSEWVDQYAPFEDLRAWSPAPTIADGNRTQARSGNTPGVNLPVLNWPETPRFKLNTLYWPTGASRWARAFFLVGAKQVEDIEAAIGSPNIAGTLLLKDEGNDLEISTSMYVLPVRPLSAVKTETLHQLYLMPLVDVRWFWQWENFGGFSAQPTTTWAQVFSQLGTQLGVSIAADSVAANFFNPDPKELNRKYENAAILLDAVASSVGQRIVRRLDGTVQSQGYTTSASVFNAANEGLRDAYALMGGEFHKASNKSKGAATIKVCFQKWRDYFVDPTGDPWPVDVANSDGQGGTEKVIFTTGHADFTTKSGSPVNATNVNNLATEIANAYKGWCINNEDYDVSMSSLRAWTPTGYDDHVEWCFGSVKCGKWQAYTRAHCRPANFGSEEQLQQFSDKPTHSRLARFELYGGVLLPGESEIAKFVDDADGQTLTNHQLTVFDTEGRTFGIVGERGWCEYKDDTLQWEIVSMDGSLARRGVAAANISAGGTGNVTVDGQTIVCENWSSDSNVSNGNKVYVWYNPPNETWYCIRAGGEGTDRVWRGVVYDPNIAPGADGLVDLSSGAQVMATNWSNDVALHTNDKVFVWLDSALNTYHMIKSGGGETAALVRFELTQNLVFGVDPVADNAVILESTGGSNYSQGDPIRVFDHTQRPHWEGLAPSGSLAKGSRGWAQEMPDRGDGGFEIVWMEPIAEWVTFTWVNPGGLTATVDEAFQGVPPAGPGGEITVQHLGLFERTNPGAFGLALRAPGGINNQHYQVFGETFAGWIDVDSPEFSGGDDLPTALATYWGSQLDYLIPTAGGKVIILDTSQTFYNATYDGTTVIAAYDAVNNKYKPIVANQKSLLAIVEANADYSPTTQDIQIVPNPFETLTPYPFNGPGPATVVRNRFNLFGYKDDVLLAIYDQILADWIALKPPRNVSRRYRGVLYVDLHSDDDEAQVHVTGALDGEETPLTLFPSVFVKNMNRLSGSASSVAFIEEDHSQTDAFEGISSPIYILYQVAHRKQSIVESVWFDGSAERIRTKEWVMLFEPADPTEGTVWVGTTCGATSPGAPLVQQSTVPQQMQDFVFEPVNYTRHKVPA